MLFNSYIDESSRLVFRSKWNKKKWRMELNVYQVVRFIFLEEIIIEKIEGGRTMRR